MYMEYELKWICGATVIQEDEIWGRNIRTSFTHLDDGDPTLPCGDDGWEQAYAVTDSSPDWTTLCQVESCKKETTGVPTWDGDPDTVPVRWWCPEHKHLRPRFHALRWRMRSVPDRLAYLLNRWDYLGDGQYRLKVLARLVDWYDKWQSARHVARYASQA
jgi:hypothetical protein